MALVALLDLNNRKTDLSHNNHIFKFNKGNVLSDTLPPDSGIEFTDDSVMNIGLRIPLGTKANLTCSTPLLDLDNKPGVFSIASFIKLDSNTVGTRTILKSGLSPNYQFMFYTDGGYPTLKVTDKNGTAYVVKSNFAINYNMWIHIAVTYNRGEVTFYLNGENRYTQTIRDIEFSLFGNNYFSIGTVAGYSNPLGGVMNDLRIYDHCLEKSEVQLLRKLLLCELRFNDNDFHIKNLNYDRGAIQSCSKGLTFTFKGIEDGWKKYGIGGSYTGGTYPYTFSIPGPSNCTRDKRQSISYKLKCNCFHKFNNKQHFTDIRLVNIHWASGIRKYAEFKGDIIYAKYENCSPDKNTSGDLITQPYSDSIFVCSTADPSVVFNPNEDFIYIKDYMIEEKTSSSNEYVKLEKGGLSKSYPLYGYDFNTVYNTAPNWSNETIFGEGSGVFGLDNRETFMINESTYNLDKDFSLSFWVNIKSNKNNHIIAHFRNTNNDSYAIIYVDGSGYFNFKILYPNGFSYHYRHVQNKVEYNKWIHIGLTYNKSSRKLTYFYNGAMKEKYQLSTEFYQTVMNYLNIGGTYSDYPFFEGSLTRFRFYARELTDLKYEYQTKAKITRDGSLLVSNFNSQVFNHVDDIKKKNPNAKDGVYLFNTPHGVKSIYCIINGSDYGDTKNRSWYVVAEQDLNATKLHEEIDRNGISNYNYCLMPTKYGIPTSSLTSVKSCYLKKFPSYNTIGCFYTTIKSYSNGGASHNTNSFRAEYSTGTWGYVTHNLIDVFRHAYRKDKWNEYPFLERVDADSNHYDARWFGTYTTRFNYWGQRGIYCGIINSNLGSVAQDWNYGFCMGIGGWASSEERKLWPVVVDRENNVRKGLLVVR